MIIFFNMNANEIGVLTWKVQCVMSTYDLFAFAFAVAFAFAFAFAFAVRQMKRSMVA